MNMEARVRGIGMTSIRTRRRLAARLRDDGIHNELVLDAMVEVPRHLFVDEAMEWRAYEDCSLPIGEGQTISQPHVVALMTQIVLESPIGGGEVKKVLEIGAGSGYQAAVLARLVDKVYTVERIRTLAHRCSDRFRQLGLRNINVRYTDGFDGWSSEAPFDAIVVTAAMEVVPEELLSQLRPGGVLVGPVGPHAGAQQLTIVRARENQDPNVQRIAPVKFVPFLSGIC